MSNAFVSGIAAGVALSLATAATVSILSKTPESLPDSVSRMSSGNKTKPSHEILTEQFTRNSQFLGADSQQLVHNARVIIVGAGGVGSHTAIALARAGVLHIRVIDFDRVTVSSLNRHATGTLAHVGLPKVESIKTAISEFLPHCTVEAYERMFTKEEADELILSFKPDYVIDCIDNVPTKVDLLEYCVIHRIRVISSCGSACKKDPTKIRLCTLSDVFEDELGRAVKQRLRQRNVPLQAIKTIYSCEKASVSLLPLGSHQESNKEEFRVLENFRIRILPVLGFVPSIFGQALAAVVVTDLADVPIVGASAREPLSTKTKRSLWEDYGKFYSLGYKEIERLFPGETTDELLDHCERRCAVSGKMDGKLVLVPRDLGLPVGIRENIILISKHLVHDHLQIKTA